MYVRVIVLLNFNKVKLDGTQKYVQEVFILKLNEVVQEKNKERSINFRLW